MANLITSIRLSMVFIIVALALYATPIWQLLNVPLIIIIIALDGLDGIIARFKQEATIFGATFDIAADRITEIILWVLLAQVQVTSIWIAIIFIVRGVLVDNLRTSSATKDQAPFAIMQTKIGKYLVAGQSMRCTMGLIKLLTFAWLLLMLPLPSLAPQFCYEYSALLHLISYTLITIIIAVNLLRGIPVILETIILR